MVAPAMDDASPALVFVSNVSSFQPDLPTHRPRAWDRLPKSPHAKRRKGQKVWKRYEAPQPNTRNEKGTQMGDGESTAGHAELNGAHAAKRLRAKDTSIDQEDEMKQKPSKYITTLRDKVMGTPRRKLASRWSLRIDRRKSSMPPTVEKQEEVPAKDGSNNDFDHSETPEEDEEARQVHSDPVQPVDGPLYEDVEEALSSPMSEKLVEEDRAPNEKPDTLVLDEPANRQHETEVVVEVQQPAEGCTGPIDMPSNFTLTADHQSTSPVQTSPSEAQNACVSPEMVATSGGIENTIKDLQAHLDEEWAAPLESETQVSTKEETGKVGGETMAIDLPNESTSPPHVRRSSQRLSEKNKENVTDDEGAEIHPASTTVGTAYLCEEPIATSVANESSGSPSNIITEEDDQFTSEGGLERPEEVTERSQQISEQREQIIGTRMDNEGKDSEDSDSITDEQPTQKTLENGTPKLPAIEIISDGAKMAKQVEAVKISPRKSTRSGARFSDDTSMLKDFLSRAQARKQAKDATIKANPPAESTPPCRSPRKALASLDSNSPSPHKPREVANRTGTPPGKVKLGEVQLEDIDETTGDASPVRRSTRKRLPAPVKTATGAPSFIPVRRADGTDPVVLHKSIAQELALITRTNTRRNKGQSKPPAIYLKSLSVQEVKEETKGGHALRSCKSVGWDKKLVYYQDGTEGKEEAEVVVEEKRPKARRLRGLGTGNGTPAPRRMTADLLSSNRTTASKRHGRTRS